MKINAINNTNFKGLFTNKSSQNGGNWRMEYSPYAWESKNGWEIDSKMANQSGIDIFGTCLPDNEKIYTEKNGKKSAKLQSMEIVNVFPKIGGILSCMS